MRALLIGINKYQYISSLNGCVNDVTAFRDLLIAKGNFDAADIVTLLDEEATGANIRKALTDLGSAAQPGDKVYIHYSGHGAQLSTSDTDEPDALDEVLCPTDFNWTVETAVRDNDILAALRAMPTTTDVVLTLDCCHSGDYVRDPGVRTPAQVPTEVQVAASRGATRRSLRAVGLSGNCLVVSACLPIQQSIETTTPGGFMGAFTHNFTSAVIASESDSVNGVVETIKPILAPLGPTGMTPVVEGSNRLRDEAYLRLSRSSPVRPALATRSSQTLWTQEWTFDVFGQNGSVAAAVRLEDGNFLLDLSFGVFGAHPTLTIPLVGNLREEIPIALGLSMVAEISDFRLSAHSLSFHLRLSVKAPFMPPMQVLRVPVDIPLEGIGRSSEIRIASLADLAALHTMGWAGARGGECGPMAPSLGTPCPSHGTPHPSRGAPCPKTPGSMGGYVPRGPGQVRIVIGPADDEAQLYVNSLPVLSTRINEVKHWQGTLGDGWHNIRTTLLNSGGWGWRATVRIFVNGAMVGNQDQTGGSGAYAGYIHEAERNWDFELRNGSLTEFQGG